MHGAEQKDHLVQKGSFISIGEHHTFVNSAGQGHGKHTACGGDEHGDGLEGMAHDEFGLGVRVRLLMEQLYARHLAAVFSDFDTVANKDESSVE